MDLFTVGWLCPSSSSLQDLPFVRNVFNFLLRDYRHRFAFICLTWVSQDSLNGKILVFEQSLQVSATISSIIAFYWSLFPSGDLN